MRKPKRGYFYAIKRDVIEELGVAATLDMLRYDGATVESNPPEGYYLFRIEEHGPKLERWASFGVRDVIEGYDGFEIGELIRRRVTPTLTSGVK